MTEINTVDTHKTTEHPETPNKSALTADKSSREVAEALVKSDSKPHDVIEAIASAPLGFVYDPDLLEDYDERVRIAIREVKYQDVPVPSLEGVSALDITPAFNPTNADSAEIYANGRVPAEFRKRGMATHGELTASTDPVEIWRIVDREKLLDGSGLVASSVLLSNPAGVPRLLRRG